MLKLSRRSILRGFLAAPIVCAPGVLMPVKVLAPELLKPVREVWITAIRHRREIYADYNDSVGAGDLDLGIPFAPMPKISARINGYPIFDAKTLQPTPKNYLPFLPDEVIEFATTDSPLYWGAPGRSSLVGSIIHVGHPGIEDGEYRVMSIASDDFDCGRTGRAEGASWKEWGILA